MRKYYAGIMLDAFLCLLASYVQNYAGIIGADLFKGSMHAHSSRSLSYL